MRKVALSILLITGFLLAQAGCAVQVSPASVGVTSTTKPEISASDRFWRTLDRSNGSDDGRTFRFFNRLGGNPGNMIVSIVPVSAETGNPITGVEPIVLGQGLAYGFSKDPQPDGSSVLLRQRLQTLLSANPGFTFLAGNYRASSAWEKPGCLVYHPHL